MLGMRFASVAVWRPHMEPAVSCGGIFLPFFSLWCGRPSTMFVWVAVSAARSRFSRSKVW